MLGRQLPPVNKLLLGLSLKFVPRPEAPATQKIAMKTFERLENNLEWNVHFAADEQTFKLSKIYICEIKPACSYIFPNLKSTCV